MKETYTYATFDDTEQASKAIDELDEDFEERNIDVMVQDPASDETAREVPWRLKTGVGPGVAVGAVVGAIVVTIVSVGANIFNVGPVLAAVQGIVAGAFAGGFIGAVAGLGYWKTGPAMPEEVSDEGKILVGVSTDTEEIPSAEQALGSHGAEHVSVLAQNRTGAKDRQTT